MKDFYHPDHDPADSLYADETPDIHERDAGIRQGYLSDFASRIERDIGAILAGVIDGLPSRLRDLPAVQNFPFVVYAQRGRVRDVPGSGT